LLDNVREIDDYSSPNTVGASPISINSDDKLTDVELEYRWETIARAKDVLRKMFKLGATQ